MLAVLDMDCASSSEPRDSPCSSEEECRSRFIEHKVCKHDSLAGLAIRYNATVSDIRRLNGLASDTAMFARDIVLIPREMAGTPQPIGPDVALLFTQLVSGIGRDACLNADQRLPGSSTVTASAARIARTLRAVNGGADGNGLAPLSTGAINPCPAWLCGSCGDWAGEADGAGPASQRHRGRRHSNGDSGWDADSASGPGGRLGLTATNSMGTLVAPTDSAGPTRYYENMRRRHGANNMGDAAADSDDNALVDATSNERGSEGGYSSDGQNKQRRHRGGWWGSGPAASGGTNGSTPPAKAPAGSTIGTFSWKQLAGALQRSAVVQRIASVATQPALAGGGAFGTSADSVISARSMCGPSGRTFDGVSMAAPAARTLRLNGVMTSPQSWESLSAATERAERTHKSSGKAD